MRQWLAPAVVVTGLAVLIVLLVMNARSAPPKSVAETSTDTPLVSTEDDEWNPVELGELDMPETEYAEVELERVEELLGYLKYGTDTERNYRSLLEELPAYLSRNLYAPDSLDGETIRIFSRPLTDSMVLTFLTRLDKLESHVYLTQAAGVMKVASLANCKIMDVALTEEYVLLATTDSSGQNSALVLLADGGGAFGIRSYLTHHGNISVYQSGELLTAAVDDVVYDVIVREGLLVLRAKNGAEILGTVQN